MVIRLATKEAIAVHSTQSEYYECLALDQRPALWVLPRESGQDTTQGHFPSALVVVVRRRDLARDL